ncbi:MAG: hypothetical protein P8Y18_09735, partial [Candidatus Bathyarchaeota archaeon]
MDKVSVTKFDESHCHKWASLLKKRKNKIDTALEAISLGDYETAKKMVDEVFHGSSGRTNDPGMEGSLLYHMAMITKMSAESKIILEELKVDQPSVKKELIEMYDDFVLDTEDLMDNIIVFDNNLFLESKKTDLS